MTVESKMINIQTKAGDVLNLTKEISSTLHYSSIDTSIINVFVVGSTAAVSIMEFENGLLNDIPKALEKLAPPSVQYEHNAKGDDNATSHIKSTFLKPSLVIPFKNKKLLLGTWQQIVLFEFDTKPRERKIVVQIVGE